MSRQGISARRFSIIRTTEPSLIPKYQADTQPCSWPEASPKVGLNVDL
jgi:hypothetical protein